MPDAHVGSDRCSWLRTACRRAARGVRRLRTIHRDELGQSMPLMIVAAGMAIVAGVLVIDVGLLFDEKRSAQAAADFAALAAAQDLPRSTADPDVATKIATAEQTARDYLKSNGYDPADPEVTAAITTTYTGDVDKIAVRVERPRSWLIGRVFGLGTVNVSGRAVAAANALARDVAIVLDRSGSMCLYTHGGPKDVCEDVTAEVGAASSTPNPLTAEIPAAAGDMVVVGATSGGNGSYTAQNGFTVTTNQTADSTVTFATAQKSAAGGAETISMQHSAPPRQELVGMTLRNDGAAVAPVGSWQTGLLNHAAGAGSDRMLVFMAGWEDDEFPDLNWVRYGGRDLRLVAKGEAPAGGSYGQWKAGVEVWVLDEAGIAAATGDDFTVSWDESVDRPPLYAHAVFEHVAQGPLTAYEPFDTMRTAADAFKDNFEPTVEGVPFDFLGLVSYNSAATLEQGLTQDYVGPGNAISTAIWGMVPATSTNIGHAIAVARMELEANSHPGNAKVIVLLTDGMANRYRTGGSDLNPTFGSCSVTPCVAAEDYARSEATLAAQHGIAIYTIGLTANAGESLLQELADIGATVGSGGQFFDVDDPAGLDETFDQIAELLNYALIE